LSNLNEAISLKEILIDVALSKHSEATVKARLFYYPFRDKFR